MPENEESKKYNETDDLGEIGCIVSYQ